MKSIAKLLIVSTVFVMSLPALAQSKSEVMAALDALQQSGRFTKAQVNAAKRQLGAMDNEQIQNLAEIGQRKLASDQSFSADVFSIKPKSK